MLSNDRRCLHIDTMQMNQTELPSKVDFKDEKNVEGRKRPRNLKSPELILWVMITMLLVKLAIILFGSGK